MYFSYLGALYEIARKLLVGAAVVFTAGVVAGKLGRLRA